MWPSPPHRTAVTAAVWLLMVKRQRLAWVGGVERKPGQGLAWEGPSDETCVQPSMPPPSDRTIPGAVVMPTIKPITRPPHIPQVGIPNFDGSVL